MHDISKTRDGVTVLGDGGWGTAIALVLHQAGADVTLWSPFPEYAQKIAKTRKNPKFLPDIEIPGEIRITSSLEDAGAGRVVFSVIPTKYLRPVMKRFRDEHRSGVPVISATKGIEESTLLRATEIIREELGNVDVAVLSGPSHAEEVARGMPTTVVLASEDKDLASRTQDMLNTELFRVYTHDDIIGVELGGALKNVISIAGGIVDGLGFGDNTKSALLSRGIVEMGRLGRAMGAQRSTFFGLSGIGDLITSCFSKHGRNRLVGERLGQGQKIGEILESMEMVAEGVGTAKVVKVLMEKHGVEMPICSEVYRVLYKDKGPGDAVRSLMTRRLKDEIEW